MLYARASWRLIHDVMCAPDDRAEFPASVPTNASVVVHKLKLARGMEYVWDVLARGRPHNAARCRLAVWNASARTRHGHKR